MPELNLNLSGGVPLAELSEAREHCEAIIEWAEENEDRNFDTSFVESIQVQIEKSQFVTANQMAALEKIRANFNI